MVDWCPQDFFELIGNNWIKAIVVLVKMEQNGYDYRFKTINMSKDVFTCVLEKLYNLRQHAMWEMLTSMFFMIEDTIRQYQ